jgi:hypothetical protein
MANEDIAWLAGLLEGEGCFTCSFQNGNNFATPRIQLTMTDQDVVEKAARLLNTKVTSTDWRTKGDKAVFRTSLARQEDLKKVLTDIHPFMGKRRQEKIDELLQVIGGSHR